MKVLTLLDFQKSSLQEVNLIFKWLVKIQILDFLIAITFLFYVRFLTNSYSNVSVDKSLIWCTLCVNIAFPFKFFKTFL